MGRTYDDGSYQSYKAFGPFAGNTINGTIASVGTAAGAVIKQFKVPANTNGIVTGLTAIVTTGGTVGSAKAIGITVGRSLAGTGVPEMAGTMTLGSAIADATAYTQAMSGTFIAGDLLSIRTAGTLTANYAPVVDFMIEWKEQMA